MNNKENPRKRYISQVYTALEKNPNLVNEDTVVAGDFNWSVMWDESPNSPLCGDFGDVQRELNQNGLYSAYHTVSGDEFGEETEATFYMHKKKERPYHIDYAFLPRELMDSDEDLTVGEYEHWIEASDHVPLVVTF
ncbi:exonuclease/endonuclease/phosphatase family protein [Haloarcula laminariae]|uniref:hypothetical protein n=1 Tax=Haloarcula laminariae TaxID=2961577 RepID=UPI002406DFB3|nr:hypothetical protein [Halomicroarcula sp. FL173]